MRLSHLPPLLRDDPALGAVLGRRAGALAVPEPARAATLAGLAHLSSRTPLVVITPTSTGGRALADDLEQFMEPGEVAWFPAWETLPFERVSPATETMGRRLEVLWRLRTGTGCPRIIVAPVRAALQRLGPDAATVEPIVVRPADRLDPTDLVARLVHLGYRREELVEHRGEVALRGSILDVFPSTADAPVRIDCWGDEVDRLTEFSVADQRSVNDLDEATILPAREVLPSDDVRARAGKLIGEQPWGREQWERLAEGTFFDGMESWLPWLVGADELMTDVLPDDAQVVLIEPRRLRDRATDLLAEEDDLARTLARTWDAGDHGFPRLYLESERLLASAGAAALHVLDVPDSPDTPALSAARWGGVGADGGLLLRRLRELLDDKYRVVIAADGVGSAAHLAGLLREQGLDVPVLADSADPAVLARPGARIVVAPLHAGAVFAEARLAVLAESDLTGRRRSHRAPRPRNRQAAGVFDDLKPGDYVVHHQHGVGRYTGMVKRAIGGVERDYLLLEYRGGDKLYIPSDQIDAIRHYTGGESPTLHRLGGSDYAAAKARVRSAVREVAQELVVLYQ